MNLKPLSFLILSFFSSILVAAELTNLSVEQFQDMQQNSDALIIDIRTEKEWQSTGIIPNSHKLEFFNSNGKYDSEKWLTQLEQLKSTQDQAVILVCRSGNRSGKVGNFLAKQQNMKNVYHLSNGIKSWIQAGKTVNPECPNQLACK